MNVDEVIATCIVCGIFEDLQADSASNLFDVFFVTFEMFPARRGLID